MIRCPQCQAEVAEGKRFCPQCGARMPEQAPPAQPTANEAVSRVDAQYNDLRRLADSVYAMIEQRLIIERESMGL